ncbi:hypothetical protein JR316_0006683 [Psilocybe cubensis]|uniref:Uncharacterized protein n=1 Tax=Psilocybe cubensis TaxID=181762 RepID=A0ACB8GXX5_PSICU|nr:hypothetical protein JR316_0006683 [Psilocybe cubensis]KAH9480086.1 hypothetical protein JR316_0006683 [Psilocybe cubensis]
MVFAQDANLASAYILKFISANEHHEAVAFFNNEEFVAQHVAPDLNATISLNAKTKSFTVGISLPGGAVNKSTWTYERPGTLIQDLHNVKGTLYTAKNANPPPLGESEFWIQQYPSTIPGEVGRTVVEFYTDKIITAVQTTTTMVHLEAVFGPFQDLILAHKR